MSQSFTITWERSGSFGYRHWSSDNIPNVLKKLNQIARQLDLQELGTWIPDTQEVLEERLDAYAESLEAADTLYPDLEEREEFQRKILKNMQDIEQRLQRLETQSKWHNPSDALRTVRGLVMYLQQEPVTLANSPASHTNTVKELEKLEQLLVDAERDSIRFFFYVD